jgi:predicted MPP superfamily phosphohydrolase
MNERDRKLRIFQMTDIHFASPCTPISQQLIGIGPSLLLICSLARALPNDLLHP